MSFVSWAGRKMSEVYGAYGLEHHTKDPRIKSYTPCRLCGEPIPFDAMDCPAVDDIAEVWDEAANDSIYPVHWSCGQANGMEPA